MDVFINDVAAFLPNKPIGNDQIEDVLGRIDEIPSVTKAKMLTNNKIRQRYYAIDPVSGKFTHNNAQLTAEAIRRLAPHAGFALNDIQCLCCGTTSPDLLMPGHALMVLGELGLKPTEAATTAGICLAGMASFKYAWMNVACGQSTNAVATGSELASSFMRADFFSLAIDPSADIGKEPILAFNAEFLRWMLSDGAGAAFMSNQRRDDRPALRIDWIESLSFAGQLDTCMYAGGRKNPDGSMTGWREHQSARQAAADNQLSVRQDTTLLGREIVRTMTATLDYAVHKHNLTADQVDWYLPHYSSDYFRDRFYQGMKKVGFEVPYDRWFTNLADTGNTGAAAIYIIMAELFHSGQLAPGQKLLCFIPESGRFSHCFMQLTVV